MLQQASKRPEVYWLFATIKSWGLYQAQTRFRIGFYRQGTTVKTENSGGGGGRGLASVYRGVLYHNIKCGSLKSFNWFNLHEAVLIMLMLYCELETFNFS